MSGKGKQPRVKGNLKPTSSSRAADLVGDDTAAINAFKANPALAFAQFSQGLARDGNGSGKRTGSSGAHTPDQQSGASTPQLSALDQIDGQLAGQLKRLGKHDANTKMRALGELRGYVAEHAWETGLEGMLLAWPPLFRRHMFDTDRRVRMAVAQVHADLTAKIGRRLAAQLKLLIGPWLAAYFDPSRDVARCARQAFEAAFAEAKRAEAIAFCTAELLAFAADNIVEQTAESLGDPRVSDPEEIRSRHEHIVGASLSVLALVVDEVAPERLLAHRPAFDAVLQSKQALALVASPALYVRRSFYRLVRAVMLRCPQLAETSHAALAQALLKHCFADADAGAHGDMWDAVLLTTKSYPQVWLRGPAPSKKGTAPIERVFEFLRHRCRLAPAISYPSILALLANLPDGVLDEPSFQPSLHSALWQGAADVAAATASITAASSATGPRGAQQGAVALVSAICECSAFLWTRTLKAGGAGAVATVGKEAAKEVDRLWHYYVQHAASTEAMAEPIVQLFRKIDGLSNKYDREILASVWAQASWFALKRVSGDATAPIVALVAQLAQLDPAAHVRLVDGARKLLEAFCQLVGQTTDAAAARALIKALAQLAPEAVFRGAHAEAFAARLAEAGTTADVVALALAKARFVLDSTGSAAAAAQSIDVFAAPLLEGVVGGALETVTQLFAALPGSDLARSAYWAAEARLPAVDAALVGLLPGSGGETTGAPRAGLAALLGRALGLYFSDTQLLSRGTADALFGWTAQVFADACGAQQLADGGNGAGSDQDAACDEVLRAWTALTRGPASGPRFVHHWLRESGGRGRTALGLLFDYAEPPSDEDAGWALGQRAWQTWAAVEGRLGELGLGAELSRALGEAIAQDVDDVRARRGPGQLARLASAVYGRICPQDDEATRAGLVERWLLDEARPVGPDEQTARAAGVAGGAGLWQAVEDAGSTGPGVSFHSAAHWLAATSGQRAAVAAAAFDAGGRSQAARRAIFGIEFLRRAGGLGVLAGAGHAALAGFVLRMALAFVLLREALLLASSNAEWSAAEADTDAGSDWRMVAQASIVRGDTASVAVLAQADRAARDIQDAVSDLLALAAVYEEPLPARGAQTGRRGAGPPPREPGQWLGTLAERVLGLSGPAPDDSLWGCVVEQVMERCRGDPGSPWVLVLGRLVQWCQWAHPLPAVCVETEVADALSRRLANGHPLGPGEAVAATAIARAVALRHGCARAPAMRSALLDAAGQLEAVAGSSGDGVHVTALLELLAELLPAGEATVEAEAAVAKIAGGLGALGGSGGVAEAVAGLAVVQRLATCAATMDAGSAAGLVRQCVRWSALDAGRLGEATVLAAAGRAADELALAAGRMQADVRPAVGTALRQLGERLVDACVLGERPVAAGAQAAAQLAESGFVAVPELPRLFPVLASAPPPLHAALVRLALAADDRAAYAAAGLDALVRLPLAAAKTLAGLVAAPADVGPAADADEFVRAAAVRLLSALHLTVQFAGALQEAVAAEHSEELSELLARESVLDAAMPWVCGLLGLAAGHRAFEAQRWDIAAPLDWQAWAAGSGSGGPALEVLALHVVAGLARAFPATLRAWWAGLPQAQRATGAAAEQFVVRHLSSPVAAAEMARVRTPDGALARVLEEYTDAHVRAGARQATITYDVDDTTLELAIRLPAAYPLAPAVLDAVRRVAVPEARWRAWVVAAQAQMARNCSVDAVCARIVGNIGAHFAGVEDCAICYSAVGTLDGSLPSKQCPTCKNAFHRGCLYKWFRTSNQSSCPLCRNLF